MKAIHEKLACITAQLKAPKGQYNSFGGFKYRSCEDILEAVKPLLVENICSLYLTDTIELIGERFYIKATVTLTDIETGENVSVSAYAREPEQKKGMDESQVTGASSSYARKYALNGMFCIDDTKDPDTDEYQRTTRGGGGGEKAEKKSAIICPVCGKEVKPQRKKENGKVVEVSPQRVYDGCGGMCYECYKKSKGEK